MAHHQHQYSMVLLHHDVLYFAIFSQEIKYPMAKVVVLKSVQIAFKFIV
jgi:hypothetical protein